MINEKDNDGYTSLHLASMNGHFSVVQLLINKSDIWKDAAKLTRTSSKQLNIAYEGTF